MTACNLPAPEADPTAPVTPPPPSRVEKPVFSPPPGSYDSDISIQVTSATSGAGVYYTTDGTPPSAASLQYTGPIVLSGHGGVLAIRAIASKSGLADSDVVAATYNINYRTVAAPAFTPPPGAYANDLSVALSCTTTDATIRFTVDGSDPTALSPVYEFPIPVAGDAASATIKAYATKNGMVDSAVVSAQFAIEYVLTPPTGLSAPHIGFDEVLLQWDAVDLAEDYALYRYYSPTPGPPFGSWGWTRIYQGQPTSFMDTGLWGGRELYYKVESRSATKGTAVSTPIRVDTPLGDVAFTHNLSGLSSYRDADAYAYRSGNIWYFLVDDSLNNRSSTFENYGHVLAYGSGPTFGDAASLIVLSPGSVDYELTSTSLTLSSIGSVGERISGTFSGYNGSTAVAGWLSVIRRPDQ